MKRFFVDIFIMSALTLVLAGCGEGNVSTETPSSVEATSESSLSKLKSYEIVDEEFNLHEANLSEYVTVLDEYKNRTAEAEKQEYSDDMISMYAQYFFASMAADYFTDNEAQLGDAVLFDYVGTMDGVEFEGGSAEDATLTLGSGQFIPGFEEGLVGIKAGETRDVEVTFPDPYSGNPDFSGKPATFKCTVKQVIPQYNEENIKAMNNPNFSNSEELKAFMKTYLQDVAERNYSEEVAGQVLNQIVIGSEFVKLPKSLVDFYKVEVEQQYAETAAANGVSVEQLFASAGLTVDDMAEGYAQRIIVCQMIANNENLNVDDAEMSENIKKLIDDGTYASEEAFYSENDKAEYRNYLMCHKVYSFLTSNSNVVKPVKDGNSNN